MSWNIYNEDAIKWAKEYAGEKFHALFTDAPYHLTSIVKRFGKTKESDDTKTSEKVRNGVDAYSRLIRTGFMGQQWDGGDIAFQPETWDAFKGVMHDGAFGMAYSASRNWHRMAVAIEDAGFVIHPTMFFLWVQGQGFPKATKVRADGFDGYKYGLQALKPAVEPIIVFQKPYNGRPVDNIVSTGAGVLNVDGGRIPRLGGKGTWKTDKAAKNVYEGGYAGEDIQSSPLGRYPANLILDEESAKRLDGQSGTLKSGKMTADHKRHTDSSPNGIYGTFDENHPLKETIGDSGGASRFFYTVSENLDEADPFLYCKKVSQSERNAGVEGNKHLTLKPIGLSKYLATLLLPPSQYAPRRVFIPFSGVASEMIGACLAGWDEVVGVEFDKENGYIDIAEKRLEYWNESQ